MERFQGFLHTDGQTSAEKRSISLAIKNLGDFLRSLVGLGDGSAFSVAVFTLAENGTILASERDALIFAHNQDHQTARKSIEILGFYSRPLPAAAMATL